MLQKVRWTRMRGGYRWWEPSKPGEGLLYVINNVQCACFLCLFNRLLHVPEVLLITTADRE